MFIILFLMLVFMPMNVSAKAEVHVDEKCTVDAVTKASGKPEELEKLKDCTLLYTGKSFTWPNRTYREVTPRWTKEANTDTVTEPPEVLESKKQLAADPVQKSMIQILAAEYKTFMQFGEQKVYAMPPKGVDNEKQTH